MIKYFNSNPTCKYFKSGNTKNWYINDSSVRAISKALDVSWEDAYNLLSSAGRKIYNVPTSKQALHEILIENNYEFVTLGKPQRGSSRPLVSEFIENHKSDTIVLNLADYFVTAIDGDIYDVSDKCLKSSVYSYWIKKK